VGQNQILKAKHTQAEEYLCLLIIMPPLCRNQVSVWERGGTVPERGLERKMVSQSEAGTQKVSMCVPKNCHHSQPRPHACEPSSHMCSGELYPPPRSCARNAALFRPVILADERRSARMQIDTYTFRQK